MHVSKMREEAFAEHVCPFVQENNNDGRPSAV